MIEDVKAMLLHLFYILKAKLLICLCKYDIITKANIYMKVRY